VLKLHEIIYATTCIPLVTDVIPCDWSVPSDINLLLARCVSVIAASVHSKMSCALHNDAEVIRIHQGQCCGDVYIQVSVVESNRP
jgi:hypothetical protein